MMTLVEVLCLNHKKKYITAWGGDVEDEQRFVVCKNALHRMFNFYGGMDRPFMWAWIYPRNDIPRLSLEIIEKNQECREPVPPKALKDFIAAWEYIDNEGLHPEFFFTRSGRYTRFSIEDFEKRPPAGEPCPSLDELIPAITIEKEPFVPEVDFKAQQEAARQRTQSCLDFQLLDRSQESSLFASLTGFTSSSLLEQRFVAVLALRYFMVGGIQDLHEFMLLMKKFLDDEYFLVRNEVMDLLTIFVTYDPRSGLKLIDILIHDKKLNLVLIGLKLMSRFIDAFFCSTDFRLAHDIDDIPEPAPFDISKILDQIYLVAMDAHDISRGIVETFVNKKVYWHHTERIERFLSVEFPDKRKDYKEYLLRLQREIYAVLSFLSSPFENYMERFKEEN